MKLQIEINDFVYNKIIENKMDVEEKIDDIIEDSIIKYFNITINDIQEYDKKVINIEDIYEINHNDNLYFNKVYAFLNPMKKLDQTIDNYYFEHEPFYIGSGNNERANNLHHRNEECTKIINYLKDNDKKPIIKILENNIPRNEAYRIEHNIISKLQKHDIKLTNLTNNIVIEDYNKEYLLETFENNAILKTLNTTRTRKKASDILGISERTLHRRIKNMDIYKDIDGIYKIKKDSN